MDARNRKDLTRKRNNRLKNTCRVVVLAILAMVPSFGTTVEQINMLAVNCANNTRKTGDLSNLQKIFNVFVSIWAAYRARTPCTNILHQT